MTKLGTKVAIGFVILLVLSMGTTTVLAYTWPTWAGVVIAAVAWVNGNTDVNNIACAVDSKNRDESDKYTEGSLVPYLTGVCDDLKNRGQDKYAIYSHFKAPGQHLEIEKTLDCTKGAHSWVKLRVIYYEMAGGCTA